LPTAIRSPSVTPEVTTVTPKKLRPISTRRFVKAPPAGGATNSEGPSGESMTAAGLGDVFGHGTGHGLGLEVHERPRIAQFRAELPGEPLQPGMVFTIEPGAYFPDWGGARIEDDAALTASGAVWLTDVPRLI